MDRLTFIMSVALGLSLSAGIILIGDLRPRISQLSNRVAYLERELAELSFVADEDSQSRVECKQLAARLGAIERIGIPMDSSTPRKFVTVPQGELLMPARAAHEWLLSSDRLGAEYAQYCENKYNMDYDQLVESFVYIHEDTVMLLNLHWIHTTARVELVEFVGQPKVDGLIAAVKRTTASCAYSVEPFLSDTMRGDVFVITSDKKVDNRADQCATHPYALCPGDLRQVHSLCCARLVQVCRAGN